MLVLELDGDMTSRELIVKIEYMFDSVGEYQEKVPVKRYRVIEMEVRI
jgi:hypothetical protein